MSQSQRVVVALRCRHCLLNSEVDDSSCAGLLLEHSTANEHRKQEKRGKLCGGYGVGLRTRRRGHIIGKRRLTAVWNRPFRGLFLYATSAVSPLSIRIAGTVDNQPPRSPFAEGTRESDLPFNFSYYFFCCFFAIDL